MDFGQRTPIVFGQADAIVLDAELVFAHDGHSIFAQEFVVVEEASGDGVLNGQHPYHRAVLLDVLEDFLERVTTDEFDVFAREELVGGDVVERARYTLYSYSFHGSAFLIE
jgi:hypothetical protein